MRAKSSFTLAAAAAALPSMLLLAPTPDRASAAELWIAPTAGYSAYEMEEVNEDIRALNPIFRPEFQIEELSGGPSGNLAVGVDFGPRWSVGATYHRLWATTGEIFEYELPANVFGACAGFRLKTTEPFTYGIGVGWGFLQLSNAHIGNPESQIDVSGDTQEFEVWLDLRFRATDRLRALVQTGYRSATVDELDAANGPYPAINGSPLEADYSGLFVRLGVHISVARFAP